MLRVLFIFPFVLLTVVFLLELGGGPLSPRGGKGGITAQEEAEEANTGRPEEVPEEGQTTAEQLQGLHGVEITKQGVPWEIWAESAQLRAEESHWETKKILWHIWETASEISQVSENLKYRIFSDRGFISVHTHDMSLLGGVKIHSLNGYFFRTPMLEYQDQKQRLHTDKKILVVGHNERMKASGVGFSTHVKSHQVEIQGEVKASHWLSELGHLDVESQEATLHLKEQVAFFKENIVLNMENLQVTGHKARVIYNRDAQPLQFIQKVIVEGDVHLRDKNKVETEWLAVADRIEMEVPHQLYTLSGNCRLYQEGAELTAHRVVFRDNLQEMELYGGATFQTEVGF